MERRKTKEISIGKVKIGGSNDIAVQSMLNVDHNNIEALTEQAQQLKDANAHIIRMAVPDMSAVKALSVLKQRVDIPLVADIHFDYKLAVESVYAGADKIRINPGNIGSQEKIKQVTDACRLKNIPIRIGVNAGSLEKEILKKYQSPTPKAICESAFYNVKLLEQFDFNDIVVSIKSSDVETTVLANRMIAQMCDYPLHIGVTETGANGIIKSSIGIGALLLDGIGDTLRVSLTAPPVYEVNAGYDILRAAGIYKKGINFISCPTCGRTKVNVEKLLSEAQKRFIKEETPLNIAIMGCAVNGPGEAKEADIAVCGGNGEGLIFAKGKIIKKVKEDMILDELEEQIKILKEQQE